MMLLWWVLGVLAAAAISEELLGWTDRLCRVVLRHGVRRLPFEWRARYAEEWEAELHALAGGPVTKLIWTFRTAEAARAVAAVRGATQLPSSSSSRPGRRRPAELVVQQLIFRAEADGFEAFGDVSDEYLLTVFYMPDRGSPLFGDVGFDRRIREAVANHPWDGQAPRAVIVRATGDRLFVEPVSIPRHGDGDRA
jgi:hypothetical protein